jgi:hypothetical protein
VFLPGPGARGSVWVVLERQWVGQEGAQCWVLTCCCPYKPRMRKKEDRKGRKRWKVPIGLEPAELDGNGPNTLGPCLGDRGAGFSKWKQAFPITFQF